MKDSRKRHRVPPRRGARQPAGIVTARPPRGIGPADSLEMVRCVFDSKGTYSRTTVPVLDPASPSKLSRLVVMNSLS